MINKKLIFSILLLAILCTLPRVTLAQQAYTLFNKEGKKVVFQDVLDSTKGKSHIFFGETHNNPIAHWLQLEMTKALHKTNGDNLLIGAEMFEADDQLLINEYFSDYINQKSFESEARLWKNYKTDYKPILEFAKNKHLKFIATNIPRRYANSVFYNGLETLFRLSDHAKSFIAPLPIVIDTNLSSYQEIKKMDNAHNAKFMMEAQAVKDATMAHFILKNSLKSSVFLHINGAYHTDNYEGILSFLFPHVKPDKILTLTTVIQEDVNSLDEKNKGIADFIISVNSEMTLTH